MAHTEVWEIANLTGDTHPIHFHLVNVQILARQPFKVTNYNGIPAYIGPAVPPDPDELGWKETVRMNPGEVIQVVMKFNLPWRARHRTAPTSPQQSETGAIKPGDLSLRGTLPRDTMAHEYVWHCHILEHEEHDMMRPLVVTE